VEAKPPAFGIVAYNDWAEVPDDYDAVGWTCGIDKAGRFRLEIGDMRPGFFQLRLKVCHANGATSPFAFDYQVDSEGKPNVEAVRYRLPLEEAVAAYAAGDRARTRTLATGLQQRFPKAPEIQGRAAHLLAWKLGGGLGHLAHLRLLGEALLARGHRVVAAVRDLTAAAGVFAGTEIPCLQAPMKIRLSPRRIEPLLSAAHVLHNTGFADVEELAALVEG
jgi:hypothetical protein